MCGRYRRTTREEELARIYDIPIPAQPDLPISYNIAPNQPVLAIRFNSETKQRSLDTLLWGLVPYWSKDDKTGFINARAERIDTPPAFRRPFHKRRCLIPRWPTYKEDCLISMVIAPLCLLVMKRLLTLTCILFWVVAGKAESIDQRNFALDTFSPTPNDRRVAEKRVQSIGTSTTPSTEPAPVTWRSRPARFYPPI